ncbi:hypothetical protein PUN28_006118 [Cardiocondyla obscurior]|uniref:Uncharacterized protein n=1 Tax=Cardiocondyla obscurior TaxID=286306 RepID=A0AAW2GA51_9HYME
MHFFKVPHNATLPDFKNIFYRFLVTSWLLVKVENAEYRPYASFLSAAQCYNRMHFFQVPHNATLTDFKNIFYSFLAISRLLLKISTIFFLVFLPYLGYW